jgi:hypothetical protein
LQTAGYTIAEGSPFRLRVTLEDKDSGRKLEYHTFGAGGGTNTVSVPDKHIECEVAFVDTTDKVVWRITNSIGPSFVSFTRGGETDFAKNVLDARWNSFDHWIKNVRIARLVRKFSSIGEYGSSALEADRERIVKVPAS